MLAACAGILTVAMTSGSAANRDFVSYWAAGQQLRRHADPYSSPAIFALEKAAGWTADRALIMRNPPFALFLTIPLGFVKERTGAVLWSLLILISLMVSVRLVWIMQGRPPDRLHLIGYLFAPALACLMAGQSSVFVLLGLTAFLYFYRTTPVLAGAGLFLCALKPHLFLPFAVVMLAWVVERKAYRLLAGTALTLLAACAVPLAFDPSVYSQFRNLALTSHVESEFVPTLGELLRVSIHPAWVWLQFSPAMAGCIWAIWYFRRNRKSWDWRRHGSLLMTVSLLVAPYCWFTDQVVLLPAMLQAIYANASPMRSRFLYWFVAIDSLALMEVLSGVQLDSVLYVWTPAAWLAWYLWSMRHSYLPGTVAQAA